MVVWLNELNEEKEKVHEANFWYHVFYILLSHFEMDVNDAYVDFIYDILFCFTYNCSLRGSELFKYSVWYVCSLLQLLNVFYLCTDLLDSIYRWRDYIWFIKNDSFKINKLKMECYVKWSLNICSHRFWELILCPYFLVDWTEAYLEKSDGLP